MTWYAHDAHCNTIHTAGPEECPPPRLESLDAPGISVKVVEGVVVRPGDTLVVSLPAVTPEQFKEFTDAIDARAGDEFKVLTLAGAVGIYVLRPGEVAE